MGTFIYGYGQNTKRIKKFIMGKMKTAASVDEYIATADPQAKKALKDIRKTIMAAAPKAEEVISYQIPGYMYHGMLVFFAGWKNHMKDQKEQ